LALHAYPAAPYSEIVAWVLSVRAVWIPRQLIVTNDLTSRLKIPEGWWTPRAS